MKRIMIIDDDLIIHTLLSELLRKQGYDVMLASNGESGLSQIKAFVPDLVITDFNMPGKSGLEVVEELSKHYPGLPVIMLTAFGDVPLTIKSIQVGAFDFVEKPIQPKRLLETIRAGLDLHDKRKSISKVISHASRMVIEANLPVGKTVQMKDIFKKIGRISMNRINVLITGEPGTGKEKIAQLIHHSGITREHPIITINCKTAHPKHLEIDLFGCNKDSMPDSKNEKPGKFEQAKEGTIYLEDFTELPLDVQYHLLEVIQSRQFRKIGSEQPLPLKARVITASSRNLEELISQGKLLKELYYQLKVFTIHIPPLRERKDDIPDLVEHLIQQINRKQSTNIQRIEDDVFELLKRHDWPGNINELENTLLQAVLLSRSDVLEKELITLNQVGDKVNAAEKTPFISLDDLEKKHIKAVLDANEWRKQRVAKILDITRPTLNAKIEKYGLHP